MAQVVSAAECTAVPTLDTVRTLSRVSRFNTTSAACWRGGDKPDKLRVPFANSPVVLGNRVNGQPNCRCSLWRRTPSRRQNVHKKGGRWPYKGHHSVAPAHLPTPPAAHQAFSAVMVVPCEGCMAITINNAQGQTRKAAGVYQPRPAFSHGQLCV